MPEIQLSDFCCQGGNKVIDSDSFKDEDLVIATRGKNTLMFSPLGNKPKTPVLALVGITPGGQSEVFAKLLRYKTVDVAASEAAFAKGQDTIMALLRAHGFAKSMGIDLNGDLNDNPKIFTTSLVKCCLKVDGSYKYKAPDIAASPEASFCVSNRFISDVEQYPSLKWIVIFGDPGWEAINTLRHHGLSIREYLKSKGLIVLNFPHFSQNFQQRAIFALDPEQETKYFADKPKHIVYAPKAQRMRTEMMKTLSKDSLSTVEETTQKAVPEKPKQYANKKDAVEVTINGPESIDNPFSELFYLLHETGDKLYPVRMKNRDTGKHAFRVSKGGAGGNTKAAGLEVENEHEMRRHVLELGYAVRAATRDKKREGLFKVGQRSIIRAVQQK